MIIDTDSLPARQNLRRLCTVRNAVITAFIIAVLVALLWLKLILPVNMLAMLFVLMALINALTYWRLHKNWPVSDRELFTHLLIDVGVLTLLLYLSGGSTNPFVTFYLVPLVLTAVSLPQRFTWMMAGLTTTCYGILLFYHQPLVMMMHNHDDVFSLHVVGMWFGFVFSAGLIAWFGVRMGQALRDRDAELANRREQELKQERVVALGALAAGAAHELGTPLATLVLLADELEPGQPLAANTHRVLREQIQRCKHILNTIAASADATRAQGGGKNTLEAFLKEIVADWQQTRPNAQLVRAEYHGRQPSPQIITEKTLAQAISNLLNNAAEASEQHVEIDCAWTDDQVVIEIADRGPGLSPELAQQAGERFVTTKSHGLGLGLYLTFATLERLGGDVKLFNRDGGGTVCRLTLPLTSLILNN